MDGFRHFSSRAATTEHLINYSFPELELCSRATTCVSVNFWPYINSIVLNFFALKCCHLHHSRSQNVTSPDERMKASRYSGMHHGIWLKTQSSKHFRFLALKSRDRQTLHCLGCDRISHSAAIFNKILYSRFPLIQSGISLCDTRSRWATVFQTMTDIPFALRSRPGCSSINHMHKNGRCSGSGNMATFTDKNPELDPRAEPQPLMFPELGKMPFGYSGYAGLSASLTLNTHSEWEWNAFPHIHSWHVFFSVLSSWVWRDSCACSSFISQRDSKMDHWQETRSTMKTSIAGFCHLANVNNGMQQDREKETAASRKADAGLFFQDLHVFCTKVAAGGARSTETSATSLAINGEFGRNTESSAQSCASLSGKTSGGVC